MLVLEVFANVLPADGEVYARYVSCVLDGLEQAGDKIAVFVNERLHLVLTWSDEV